jgi:Xaa-Pro aminopeptidase
MTSALKKAGLTNTWVLALVDDHTALPHGDSSETKVKKDSVVLIDTGGELYGKYKNKKQCPSISSYP